MSKLPNKLIKFKSSEKSFHEKPDMNDLANCCSPVFCLIAGGVNCGKSSLLKNLLCHKNPIYDRIVVYSPMGNETSEYSEVIDDVEMIDEIPDYSFSIKIKNMFYYRRFRHKKTVK